MEIRLKRIYETPSEADGLRVLVDRLWPRGIKKDDAKVDLWVKTLAPTTALRKWFDHDVAKWNEFRTMYSDEIRNNDDFKTLVERISAEPVVTLLFGAKDTEHNNAVVLAEMVKNYCCPLKLKMAKTSYPKPCKIGLRAYSFKK